jgi:site-specific DNA recombinase
MNVALYLRMSSDKQETSLAQQEEALRGLCGRKGYRIVDVYKDEGISGRGDKTASRLGFQRMIVDAQAGKFKRIVCYDQDRFSRADMLEAGGIIEPLRKAKVTLETIAQGLIDWNDFGGRVAYGVLQEGKHQYIRDVSRLVLRGNASKMEKCDGFPGGPAPFGYRRVTRLEGTRHISHLVIDEPQAEIVRRLFREYALPHMSGNLLAGRLTRDKVPSPRGSKVWRRENICRMLTNRAYIGFIQWGKTSTGVFSARTENGVLSLPQIEKAAEDGRPVKLQGAIVHYRPDLAPPIVDAELFTRVQELMQERKRDTRSKYAIHPLSGMIVCEKCGRRMHASGSTKKGLPCYRCSSARYGDGKQCEGQRVPEGPLLDSIVDALHEAFGSPAHVSLLTRRLQKLLAEKAEAKKGDPLAGPRKRLSELERQLTDGMSRLTLVPPGLVPELCKTLDRLRQDRDALAGEIAAGSQETTPALSPEGVVEEMLELHRELRRGLRRADPATVNEGLRRLGTSVTIDKRKGGELLVKIGLLRVDDSVQALKSSKPPAVFSAGICATIVCSGRVRSN